MDKLEIDIVEEIKEAMCHGLSLQIEREGGKYQVGYWAPGSTPDITAGDFGVEGDTIEECFDKLLTFFLERAVMGTGQFLIAMVKMREENREDE